MSSNPRIDECGVKRWYNENGYLHRLDGPAVEYASGNKEWWINDQLHRLDGPAIEWTSGYKAWYADGKQHRLDGPAVEYSNRHKSWWINDIQYTEEEYWDKISELQVKVATKPKVSRFKNLEIS